MKPFKHFPFLRIPVVMTLIMSAICLVPVPGGAAEAGAVDRGGQTPVISSFMIEEGNNINYFLLSPAVSCHLLVTNEANPRILANFPAGNSGIALWFDRASNDNLKVSLLGSLTPFAATGEAQGVRFGVMTNRREVTITSFMLDSVRQIRNYGRPDATEVDMVREKFCNELHMPRALKPYAVFATFSKEGSSPASSPDFHDLLLLRRKTLKNLEYVLELRLPLHVKAATAGKKITLKSETRDPVAFEAIACVPFRPLTPYEPASLFSKKILEYQKMLATKAGVGNEPEKMRYQRLGEAMRNLQFLSYREKYLAGSWRFMTYFGRDTMLSLLMLKDIITPGAYGDGMQSVIDRLDHAGNVAHEEDVGTWAEYRAIEAVLSSPGRKLPDDFEKPFFDYKMIDDDFLLPLMERSFFTDPSIGAGDRKQFLARKAASGEENGAAMVSNWNYVISHALPFGQAMQGSPEAQDAWKKLIRIAPGYSVGDWRDSPCGLGGGAYPSSVNVYTVAESLASIGDIISSGSCTEKDLKRWLPGGENKAAAQVIEDCATPGGRKQLDELVRAWRDAKRFFKIDLDAEALRARLKAYMEGGLSDGERAYFLSRTIDEGITFKEFLAGGRVPRSLSKGLSFYGLSLDGQGAPISIESSDFSFMLLLGDPDPSETSLALRLIELPFPLGLRSDAGIFVCNPALSTDPSHWKSLGRKAYHGTVIWSWQMYMIELGLARQVERFGKAGGQEALVARLRKALVEVKGLREAAGGLANSELWSYVIKEGKMVPAAFGAEAGSDDESNAVQLWSTIVPSVMMKEESILGKGSR
jgi:hypothetical protein